MYVPSYNKGHVICLEDLMRSALAFELSACFEYAPGAPELPSHVRWQGRRFALTMDLAPLLLAAPPP